MSKQANPAAIGAFVLGALVVAFMGLVFFGSSKWFGGERIAFVCFFEGAVDGLQIGSKVNLKGVPIGEVKQILIRFRPTSGGGIPANPSIPVILELNRKRLSEDLGVDVDLTEKDVYQQQIREGLRATLGMGNLITGILQVSLDYHADVAEPEDLQPFVYQGNSYRIIPTIPSQFDRATKDLLSVVANISETDFKGLVDGLKDILEKIGGKFDQFEVKGINEAITSIEARMNSPKFDEALIAFTEAVSEIKEVASRLNDQMSNNRIAEVLESSSKSMESAGSTFDSLQETVDSLNAMILENQEMPPELRRSLKEIGDAAGEIKLFVEELREAPNSLIFGKKKAQTGEEEIKRERTPWKAGPRS